MKLLRTFPKDAFEFGLASWQWLGLREQTPRFATCFGDIFLESLDGWWFLDTVEGTLELRWTSAVTMYAELESPEGRATYLMDDLVRDARSRGIHLGEEDVYMFNPHPALGGELGVNSLGAMRFELAVNWVGQMHDQLLHGSNELRLPPLPDDGRGARAPQAGADWDPAWSQDETFDVPFEQYLATTTFAAVASPTRHAHGSHAYAAPVHETHTGPARPDVAVPWPGRTEPAAASWPDQTSDQFSGQTRAADPWPEPSHDPGPAAPSERYGEPYDRPYPAATPAAAPDPYRTSAAEQQPAAAPQAHQGWVPYDTGHEVGYAGPDHGAAAWGRPTWGNTWGGQAAAVAAGSPQQGSSADDPFTAWDDLWGKR